MLVAAFTGLMWVPYILDRIAVRGIIDAVGFFAQAALAWQRLAR